MNLFWTNVAFRCPTMHKKTVFKCQLIWVNRVHKMNRKTNKPLIVRRPLPVGKWLACDSRGWPRGRGRWGRRWPRRSGCESRSTRKTGRRTFDRSPPSRVRVLGTWVLRRALSCRSVSSPAFPSTKPDSPHPYVWLELQARWQMRLSVNLNFIKNIKPNFGIEIVQNYNLFLCTNGVQYPKVHKSQEIKSI